MDVKTIPERWVAAWSSTDRQQEWVSLYTPDGTYVDHAFLIRRSGHKVLARHHDLWRTANPDFVMTIASDMPIWWDVDEKTGNGKCSFRTINKGTFKNDLLAHKATGKQFEFRGVIDMVFEGGKIKRLDEWYTMTRFDETKPLDQYHTLTGEDLKG